MNLKMRKKAASVAEAILSEIVDIPSMGRRPHPDAPTMREILACVAATYAVVMHKGDVARIIPEALRLLQDPAFAAGLRKIPEKMLKAPGVLKADRWGDATKTIDLGNRRRILLESTLTLRLEAHSPTRGVSEIACLIASRRTGSVEIRTFDEPVPADVVAEFLERVAVRIEKAPWFTGTSEDLRQGLMRDLHVGAGSHGSIYVGLPSGGRTDVHVRYSATTFEHGHPDELMPAIEREMSGIEKTHQARLMAETTCRQAMDTLKRSLHQAGLAYKVSVETHSGGEGRRHHLMAEGLDEQYFLSTLHVGSLDKKGQMYNHSLLERYAGEQAKRLKTAGGRMVTRSIENVDMDRWTFERPLLRMLEMHSADPEAVLRQIIVDGERSASQAVREMVDDPAIANAVFEFGRMTLGTRIKIAPTIQWANGTLVIRRSNIPSMLAQSLIGRTLGDVVQHPFLDPALEVLAAVPSASRTDETLTITLRSIRHSVSQLKCAA